MDVKVDAVDKHKVALTITVPAEEVTKGFRQAISRIANQVNLKGFRRGKAPRNVLEMYFGKEAIEAEAADIIIDKAFNEALKDQKIVPVTKADIDRKHFAEGEEMTFVATFVKQPDVKLGQYKELSIAHDSPKISDKQVEDQLFKAAEQNARLEVANDEMLKKGDFAIIDFEGKVDGKPFKGGEGKTYPLEIGSHSFIPGFEDQLEGHKAGDDVTVKVAFPEGYFVKELAGKGAEFSVHISDVKKKVIPALDDEFAKSVSEYETIDELKKNLKQRMQLQAIQNAEEKYQQDLVDLAVKNSEVDIPDEMVDTRIDEMLEEMKLNLESRNSSFEAYLKTVGKTEAEIRVDYKDTAKENVRQSLVLKKIAEDEDLKVTDQDLSMEIYSMAHRFNAAPKDVLQIIKKENRVPMLIESVTRKKAAAFVYGSAQKAEAEAEAKTETKEDAKTEVKAETKVKKQTKKETAAKNETAPAEKKKAPVKRTRKPAKKTEKVEKTEKAKE